MAARSDVLNVDSAAAGGDRPLPYSVLSPILPPVTGQMYHPAVQRAILEKLARWRRLPQGDLLDMLGPEDRLRFRPEALEDLVWEGLVQIAVVGDEPVVSMTPAGDARVAELGH